LDAIDFDPSLNPPVSLGADAVLLYNATFVREITPQCGVVLEVGACGERDAVFIKGKFPEARVVTIEAVRENYDRWLVGRPEFESHCFVATDHDGEVPFLVKTINGISSMRERGQGGTFVRNVPAKKLDTFCMEVGIGVIDWLKIDVEGCTFEVLSGARDVLKRTRVVQIETETHEFFSGQHLHDECIALLDDFRIVAMFQWEIKPQQFQREVLLWRRGDREGPR
jgi:FkbM family methyltransferase